MTARPILPWIFDIASALILIAACVAAFALMGFGADYLQEIGWLS